MRCYHRNVKHPKTLLAKAFLVLVTGTTIAVYAGALPATNLAPVPSTVDSITPSELRMHLEFLASDELGGRYTLAPNFAIAARYLAAHLEAYGFHGAGDHGSFLQTFEVLSAKPDAAKCSLEIKAGDKSNTFSFGEFLLTASPSAGEAQGQIVFVGAGPRVLLAATTRTKYTPVTHRLSSSIGARFTTTLR